MTQGAKPSINLTRVPELQNPGAQRTIWQNFLALKNAIERAVLTGGMVVIGTGSIITSMIADGAITLVKLAATAKQLVGDVTGTIGSTGSTTVGKIQGKTVPAPGAPEDTKVLQWNNGTGAFQYVSLPAGGSGDGRVDRTQTADLTLLDGECMVCVDYMSFDDPYALILQGDSVLRVL